MVGSERYAVRDEYRTPVDVLLL
ncbi:hypothetical protein, partial [Frankia sp. CpI1-P]